MTRLFAIGVLFGLLGGVPVSAASLLSGDVEIELTAPGDIFAPLGFGVMIEMLGERAGGNVPGHVDMDLTLPAGAELRVAGMPGFVPTPLPGFGSFYGSVRAVVVDGDGQLTLEPGQRDIDAAQWIGVRNRFQVVLVTGVTGSVDVAVDVENQPVVTLRPDAGKLSLRVYAGPIESWSVRSVDPVLSKMLFAALWDWLRWLCFGMLWLLMAIDGVIGNIGASIVLLSLAVKILMWPLTKYADSLQASVNRTQALLQPRLDEIKRNFKGEEAHNRTLAVYKEHGVNPLYTLKSLVGFLIQIPIFIAAFDMLGENIALDGASFLWIDDLAKPDNWIALPIALPFFGGHLNLLPILMTAVTLLTSWLQKDPHLTPELMRSQRTRLYWMALAFFLLFYTFPAGMVLYWTTNNLLHLAKITLWGRTSTTS